MEMVRYMRDGSTQKIEVGNYPMITRGQPGKTAYDHKNHHHARNRQRKAAREDWQKNVKWTDNTKFPV